METGKSSRQAWVPLAASYRFHHETRNLVRGQFRDYVKEKGVAPNSQVETYAALKLEKTIVTGPGGVPRPGFVGNVDLDRLDNVIARIIKGIFYKERGVRLPSGYRVVNYSTEGLRRLPMEVGEKFEEIVEGLIGPDPKHIGGPQFREEGQSEENGIELLDGAEVNARRCGKIQGAGLSGCPDRVSSSMAAISRRQRSIHAATPSHSALTFWKVLPSVQWPAMF
jgi:hypothetical protein